LDSVESFMGQAGEVLGLTLIDSATVTLTLEQVLLALVALIVGLLVARIVERVVGGRMRRAEVGPDMLQLVRRLLFYGLMVMVVLAVLAILGIPLTAFAFVSGAIAIGVGFGAQNIINNFISGWILMGEQPIRIDDYIELEDVRGRVEAINNRSTRIRRTDGVHLLVPNSALIFGAYFWLHASSEGGRRRVCSDIRFAIDEVFAEHGIVIAFPQRDIHVDGSLVLRRD